MSAYDPADILAPVMGRTAWRSIQDNSGLPKGPACRWVVS
jgi:hypothetical protein